MILLVLALAFCILYPNAGTRAGRWVRDHWMNRRAK